MIKPEQIPDAAAFALDECRKDPDASPWDLIAAALNAWPGKYQSKGITPILRITSTTSSSPYRSPPVTEEQQKLREKAAKIFLGDENSVLYDPSFWEEGTDMMQVQEGLWLTRAEYEDRAQQVIALVLEEAARVAEARDLSIMSSTVVDIEARKIAAAIRALIPSAADPSSSS
jgi:hypothetical protein